MNITVNVRECRPDALDRLMGDMEKIAGLDFVRNLEVNVELVADYGTDTTGAET